MLEIQDSSKEEKMVGIYKLKHEGDNKVDTSNR